MTHPPHPCMTPHPPLHDPPHPTSTWPTHPTPAWHPTHPYMTHPTPPLHDPPTPPTPTWQPTPPLHDPPHLYMTHPPHPYMTHPTPPLHDTPHPTPPLHDPPTPPLHDTTHPTPPLHDTPHPTPPHPYMTHPTPPHPLHDTPHPTPPTPSWHTHPTLPHPTPPHPIPSWPTHPTPPHPTPWYIFGHKGTFFHGLLHYVSLSVDNNYYKQEAPGCSTLRTYCTYFLLIIGLAISGSLCSEQGVLFNGIFCWHYKNLKKSYFCRIVSQKMSLFCPIFFMYPITWRPDIVRNYHDLNLLRYLVNQKCILCPHVPLHRQVKYGRRTYFKLFLPGIDTDKTRTFPQ